MASDVDIFKQNLLSYCESKWLEHFELYKEAKGKGQRKSAIVHFAKADCYEKLYKKIGLGDFEH